MLKSPEYPKSPKSPKFPKSLASPCVSCVSVSPVSEGQGVNGELEKELKGLATRNACTSAGDVPEKKRFKLARDVRAVEERIGRELTTAAVERVLDEWYCGSQPFLPAGETRDDHLVMFLAELTKVRFPTGQETIKRALERVSTLSTSELPEIPGMQDPPEERRRIVALHRELSRLCANGTYFLSYRDAAKAYEGLSQQKAHTITFALVRLRVIKIVRKGKAGLNSRKAAEFRYLLSQGENGAQEYNGGFQL
jgi:hypothetical protein